MAAGLQGRGGVKGVAVGFRIQRLEPLHGQRTVTLLDELRVSLFGVASVGLYEILVDDATRGRIDARIATDGSAVAGVVIAAPASYWRSALLAHPSLALQCAASRLRNHAGQRVHRFPPPPRLPADVNNARPPYTWNEPGDAWRVVIVGTGAASRGRGIATRLYERVMEDRSLVARIAADNSASLRLHQSLGWQLFPDGDVILGVHTRQADGRAGAGGAVRTPRAQPTSR